MKKNRTAIITGGAQGIGKIITKTFLKHEINVIIFDVDAEAGKEMINEFKNYQNLRFVKVDVSDEMEIKQAIQNTVEIDGSIDILINNAAISENKHIAEVTYEEWNRVISVNLGGAFLCSKYCYPYLKNSNGCIINMCSTRAFMSEPNTEAYSASKGGIFAFTHSLAMSFGPEIRVNSISPGWIDVTMHQKSTARKPYNATTEDHSQHPAGRIGRAEDIANTVLFLINPENDFITGQNFIVDGGMTRKMIYV